VEKAVPRLGSNFFARLKQTLCSVADQIARLHGLAQLALQLGGNRLHQVQMLLHKLVPLSRHDKRD